MVQIRPAITASRWVVEAGLVTSRTHPRGAYPVRHLLQTFNAIKRLELFPGSRGEGQGKNRRYWIDRVD